MFSSAWVGKSGALVEIGSKQALKFTFGQAETFESLEDILPLRLDVRGLLQELVGSFEAIEASYLESIYEGGPDPTIPIQPPKQLLIDGHWDHVREPLVGN